MSKRKDRYVVGYTDGSTICGNDKAYSVTRMSLEEARRVRNTLVCSGKCIYKLVEVVEEKPDLRLATINELVSELLIRQYDRHKLAQGEER